MICNAVYDSFDEIPEALRGEFENRNGKYQLKSDAIPGVGPLFNPALAANEQKAVDQAKRKGARIKELEAEIAELTSKMALMDEPGAQILSKADGEVFAKYTALGSVKELETMKDELAVLRSETETFKLKESLATLAKDGSLNPEVLTDWATSADGKGLTFFTKTVETEDKGVKVSKEVPYVKIETVGDNGKVSVTEKELLPFAKEKLPEWKFNALTTVNGKKTEVRSQVPASAPGVKLPDFGSAAATSGGEPATRPVDRFNQQRSAAPNPFAPKTQATK